MKAFIVGTLVVLGSLIGSTVEAVPFVVDQANDGFNLGLRQQIQFFSPIGQEFTPTFTGLDVVELITQDFDGRATGAVLRVNIRLATIFGALLGTSNPTIVPNNFEGVTHFDFPAIVPLVPGQLYVMEVLAMGDAWGLQSSGGPRSTYPFGRQILQGLPQPGNDLWFREGMTVRGVPEPGALTLLGAGLIAVFVARRRDWI